LRGGVPTGPLKGLPFECTIPSIEKPKLSPPFAANGLKYYDVEPGKGTEVAAGARVTAHFDCMYRGIDVVSTRSSRLLGGNRTVAEPFEFIAGEPVRAVSRRAAGDAAGGLFAGGSGPKPPPALSTAVIGMKVGGKVRVCICYTFEALF
jgi:peptidylprolyl isomerase